LRILDAIADAELVYDLNFARMTLATRIPAMVRAARGRVGADRLAPAVMLVGVTARCQCSCRHCGVREDSDGPELTTAEIDGLLTAFRARGGIKVFFFGGEPLLRDDLDALVARAAELGLVTCVSSNGLLLDEARARSLRRAGLCSIEFSLDSADDDEFSRLRGHSGMGRAVRRAVRTARQAGIPVSIATYAYRSSLDGGLAAVVAAARAMQVRSVRVLEPIAAGRWHDQSRELLQDEQDRQRMLQVLEPGFVHTENQGKRALSCSVVRGQMLNVFATGKATPCCYMDLQLGDVRHQSFDELLDRLRIERDAMPQCHGCPVNDPTFRRRAGLDRQGVCD